MTRESDWAVFEKACEITAMAARGTADQVTPAQVGEIFTQVYGAPGISACSVLAR